MAGIETRQVTADETGMRLDRWFKSHFPGLGFGALQKLLRTGQVRVDGKRAKSDFRVAEGQSVRLPPQVTGETASTEPATARSIRNAGDSDALRAMTLFEDDRVMILNKPAGLAVQGGSGVARHVDGMLEALRNKRGEKPRLVHRLDRDTSGVLAVAKTRSAAQALAEAFRKRTTQKTYWAIVKGTPPKREGRISNWLAKEQTPDGDRMRVVKHGTAGADHAESRYRVVETAGQRLTWLELEPETGRTHQLRVHCLSMQNPIIGDPKYFEDDPNWDFPGGIQKRLHLHARRLRIPHPSGGWIDETAPLPPHMVQTWNLLGLDEASGDFDD
ncbi:MAG: RluA family pseudouridine synthase [Pseudomonadota bacterium]